MTASGERCHATKTNGQACHQWAMRGQKVCKVHGGKAPQNLARAARINAEQEALRIMETYGRPVETTAVEALLDEIKYTAGHVAWLRARVAELETGQVVWGLTRVKEGGQDAGTTEEAMVNMWVRLYQIERTHLVKVCEASLRAGIEERRVRLAESQGELVASVIKAILADLNLSGEQQARVVDIVPRHLRALAG